MNIKFLFPRWGFENIPWEKFLSDVKREGFSGIEWFPYARKENYSEILSLLKKFDLQFAIVMAVDRNDDVNEYLAELKRQLTDLASMRMDDLVPVHITAHTGREYFNEQQIEACINCCDEVSRDTGISIYHETHRNKWTYAAHVVHPILKKHPQLLLTLDVSHWFCVSESYLEDQRPAVELAIQHARHIHARVGHIEGPQVFDPALPEYKQALDEHLKIWDEWIHSRILAGAETCTITPEFGPPPYMIFGNREGSPVEEQWRQNCWMKNLLEERYRQFA